MRLLPVLLIVAGCSESPEDLDLVVSVSPALVSYRAPELTWTIPKVSLSDEIGYHYRLPYSDLEIVVVCIGANGTFVSQELFVSREELPALLKTWPRPVCAGSSTGVTYSVSGQMVQNGIVAMNGAPFTKTGFGPWSFSFNVAPGTNDLVALASDYTKVLLRRGQAITSDFSEPTVDLDVDGSPSEQLSISIPDLRADETVTNAIFLDTEHGAHIEMPASAQEANVFPGQVLNTKDFQALSVYLSTGLSGHQSTRTAWAEVTFGAMEIDMPPRLQDILYSSSNVGASWTILPTPFDSVRLDAGDANGEQVVTATAGWIGRLVDNELSFDINLPGYDPAWTVNPGAASVLFSVDSTTDHGSFSTVDIVTK